MNIDRIKGLVSAAWDSSVIPTLSEYIRIPNKSIHFDPLWAENGHVDRAAALLEQWCKSHALPGMTVETLRLPGRTPLLFIDVPASRETSDARDCVLLYGHMDKQPEFTGWAEGLSPWEPVLKDGRLYGRGGADDGYAVFGSLLALRALADQNIPHARCVILIEASEESGSPDLPAYIDALADRIGEPSLVVCLDAECGNYDQFWVTSSLRGNLLGTLKVQVLTEGVHSGMASGIVPSSFRVVRQLLERLEDANTGEIRLPELNTTIPPAREQQAQAAARALGNSVHEKFPFVSGMRATSKDTSRLLIESTWRATLSVTGADGIPSLENAGNVLRPFTALKLSFRLPPGVDPNTAASAVKRTLESDPPYGAKVSFEVSSAMGGWNAPALDPWLAEAIQSASRNFFGPDAMYMGVGGTIPFMGMLAEKFPKTQFLVTGVLGPHSNAHGPNEFLDIETGKRVTGCVAEIIAKHAQRASQ
jgi:acetylornithine deacetylase/succinyl-diaminopimelate desuccinylase-like protein